MNNKDIQTKIKNLVLGSLSTLDLTRFHLYDFLNVVIKNENLTDKYVNDLHTVVLDLFKKVDDMICDTVDQLVKNLENKKDNN